LVKNCPFRNRQVAGSIPALGSTSSQSSDEDEACEETELIPGKNITERRLHFVSPNAPLLM
jgi:hypothetical protein